MRGATAVILNAALHQDISIHAPHAGCDIVRRALRDKMFYFNPRTPCGVRHLANSSMSACVAISIHAPHAGCDTGRVHSRSRICNFNPRTPCGVRRECAYIADFVYTISIHAPHAGCDANAQRARCSIGDFNPRTPCGVRPHVLLADSSHLLFQSTHPMRGATNTLHFDLDARCISIHAPHAGCDHLALRQSLAKAQFQSTHPMRGATGGKDVRDMTLDISIHAPHAGCDHIPDRPAARGVISIHAPHAGCDPHQSKQTRQSQISIHAPHAGCDCIQRVNRIMMPEFQSTHPMRGATAKHDKITMFHCIKHI